MLLSIGDERSPSPAPNCQGRSAFSSSSLYCLNTQIEPNQPFPAKLPRWKQAKITSPTGEEWRQLRLRLPATADQAIALTNDERPQN